ncbi:spinster family MFS transporter [Roseibium sp.]|uniref:spinster family MFS transporter n=1 Tax=Roseibium sp. TaxID=1936156 RepID=UPI003B51CCDD
MNTERRWTLAVLTAVFAVNNLDRHVLSIVLDPIGQEFALSDTQLGLLSGLMFALVYVLFGFPIAKLSAKGNRRNIISTCVALWSSLTIAMAGAQNFVQLAVARLGVGIGEAGAVTPAHSMISDLYPKHKRTSAMATFVTGANIGILLAFLIGGIAGQLLGWRWAFVIAGLPGLVLAVLLKFTVTEPVREKNAVSSEKSRSLFLSSLKTIYGHRGMLHAMLGISIVGVVTFGALAWNPTLIIRSHGLTQAQTGIFLALVIGIGGGFGTWFSGKLADWLGEKNAKWRVGIVVAAILISKPFVFVFLLADNTATALAAFAVAAFMGGVFWAPTFAYLHSNLSSVMRPMGTAIYLFCFNLVGVGLGPTIIGILSDTVFSEAGNRSIAYGLLTLQIAGIWAAWHYWQVVREIPQDAETEEKRSLLPSANC